MEKHLVKHFYIFRHGECPLNRTGHIQGQTFNGKLTEHGRRQAQNVGMILKDKKIEVIISSPMERAMQTAKIVREYLGEISILVDKRITEVNMGVVEGMHISCAEKMYSETYKKWRSGKLKDLMTAFKNGESKADVRKRIFEVLEYYANNIEYLNIAISTHGIAISQILQYFGMIKRDIPNGSILLLKYFEHRWKYEGFIDSKI